MFLDFKNFSTSYCTTSLNFQQKKATEFEITVWYNGTNDVIALQKTDEQ